ncbi:MAG: hypothetical protein V3R16_02485 [Nitrospirales bacterium]
MKDSQLWILILGMTLTVVLFALLALLGPGVIPSQLDKCWIELQKAQPNCQFRQTDGVTYIRDVRCIRPSEGLQLIADGDSGWYKVARAVEPTKPVAATEDQ